MTSTVPATGNAPTDGVTFVPSSGGVVSLNYFDGRFLRADDLNLERRGQREYGELSNHAIGPGPVWGFDVSGQGTAQLQLSAGLGLTPRGRVLYLPDDVRSPVAALLAAPAPGGGNGSTSPSAATGFTACAPSAVTGGGATTVAGTALYVVCLVPASQPQGVSEVFGRLCEGRGTPTDSAYLVDGVSLQLRPLSLDLQPWTGAGLTGPDHLRSQVASSYFEAERRSAGPDMSAALLASTVWRAGAASTAGDDAVALGVLGWDGTQIRLLDAWTARRESLQAPPAGYWAGRFEQRPMPVFLAQVLQFQAQLAAAPAAPGGSMQQLVDRGFVELPPAGYLPVPPTSADLHDVLAAQFGTGVELRLCAVRRDQIPQEFERGRHRDRISLLRGLRDAGARERVDVFVPDGTVTPAREGLEFALDLAVGTGALEALEGATAPRGTAVGRGAARLEPGVGIRLQWAVAVSMPPWGKTIGRFLQGSLDGVSAFRSFAESTRKARPVSAPDVQLLKQLGVRVGLAAAAAGPRRAASVGVAVGGFRVLALEASLTLDVDPFELADGKETGFRLEASGYQPSGNSSASALLRVWGTARRESATSGGITFSVSGGFGATSTESGSTTGTGGAFENRTVVLRRTGGNGTTIIVTDAADGLTLEAQWSGDPVRAQVVLQAGEAGEPEGDEPEQTEVAAAVATQDPSVLVAGNDYRESALTALAMLAVAHPDDPQFAERAAQALFPPGDTGTARVAARRDWVLFRRGERQDCEGSPVTATPADTVKVRVFTAKDADAAAKVVDAVLSGTGKGWPTEWKDTDVAFQGGATTLLTPAQTVQQRYLTTLGGAEVVALAGYAASAGSLGALVGVGRIKALLSALAPVAALQPGAPTLPVVAPDTLQPPSGTDGTVFLVTRPPAPDQPPVLAVRALMVRGNDSAVKAVLAGDTTLVTIGDPFQALGEGGTGSLQVDRVVGEFTTLLNGRNATVEPVLWTLDPLPAEVAEDLGELGDAVEAAIGAVPKTTVETRRSVQVAFAPTTDGAVAQLFLLVTVASSPD